MRDNLFYIDHQYTMRIDYHNFSFLGSLISWKRMSYLRRGKVLKDYCMYLVLYREKRLFYRYYLGKALDLQLGK